eukprot:3941202-Rhodomonas_salina.2
MAVSAGHCIARGEADGGAYFLDNRPEFSPLRGAGDGGALLCRPRCACRWCSHLHAFEHAGCWRH